MWTKEPVAKECKCIELLSHITARNKESTDVQTCVTMLSNVIIFNNDRFSKDQTDTDISAEPKNSRLL